MKLPGCTRGTEIVVSSFKTQGYLRKTLQNGFLLFHLLLYVSERGLNCLSVLQGLTHNTKALGKSSRFLALWHSLIRAIINDFYFLLLQL